MTAINRIVSREKVPDGRFERQILTGMIISTEFLQGMAPLYQEGCLRIPFAQTIARWILEYFAEYQVAPKKQIEDIFRDKKDSIPDPDETDMIENFLTDISKEYVKQGTNFNAKYILDKTETHFRELSLKNLTKDIQKAVIDGKIEEAEALVKGYTKISRMQTKGIDPIFDTKVIAAALDENIGDKLFHLPGVLGETIGDHERGQLFAYVGASGSGKSWMLMLTALRALLAGLNVLFISMEMSEKQMTRRIQSWITGLSAKRWAEVGIKVPFFRNSYNAAIDHKIITKNELTISKAIQKAKAVKRAALIRGGSFKLVTYPSQSVTMDEIKAHLYNLERHEGKTYDVIVTDYADKVKADDSRMQYRHQIAAIWSGHKALAQEHNCFVATASQSNTSRTGQDIKQGDWAESISKLELLDSGVALNASPKDKENGVIRALMVKQRDDYFNLNQQIMILQGLKFGNPYINSRIMTEAEVKEAEAEGKNKKTAK